MRTRRLFIGLAAVALSLGTVALLSHARGADGDALVGKPAPDFTLDTFQGDKVKLSELKGHVVVLDFWATWCPPCRKGLPHIQELSEKKEFKEQGLRVMAVNLRETKEKIGAFVKENKYSFNVPMDKEGKVAEDYKVEGIPTTVIIDRQGVVKKVIVGLGPAEQLDKAVEEALKEGKPKTASAQ